MNEEQADWVVTFGADHIIRGGQVQQGDFSLGGLGLGRFYAVVKGWTVAHARARVLEIFGPGNWSGIYPVERGLALAERHGMTPLFTVEVTAATARIPLCGCQEPSHPHCLGWHEEG